jgi:hypothetical protein
MHIWVPELNALTSTENANHLHHSDTPEVPGPAMPATSRGTSTDETLEWWGAEAAVHHGPHTWPVWGNNEVVVGFPLASFRRVLDAETPDTAFGSDSYGDRGLRRACWDLRAHCRCDYEEGPFAS